MLASKMPVEFVAHATGHDLTPASALWEHVKADLALCIVSANVLSGWKAFPWAQLGDAPVPASLAVLEAMGVSAGALDDMIDFLYR